MIWNSVGHVALCTLLGAIAFRLRGSSIVHITPLPVEGRIIYVAVFIAIGYICGLPWWSALLGIGFFGGCVMGWFHTIDLGRNEGTFLRDFSVMAFRGVLWTILPGIMLFFASNGYEASSSALLFAFSGVVCPIWYELGWRIPLRVKHLTQGPELGEVFFGAWLGFAYSTTLIFGA